MSLRSGRRTLTWMLGQAALLVIAFAAYKWVRTLIVGHEDVARVHAGQIHRFEAWMHLPSESWLQSTIPSGDVFRALNTYYTSVHFPLMAAFVIVGLVLRPVGQFIWARDLLLIQTAVALVIHVLYPLAPPRMFSEWGFVDTMNVYGPSAYADSGGSSNQFLAMPSLHVGWAVLIAYVVVRTGPRWLAVVVCAHAALTWFIVVVTANHWIVDGVVGIALLVLADLVLRVSGRDLNSVQRRATPVPGS